MKYCSAGGEDSVGLCLAGIPTEFDIPHSTPFSTTLATGVSQVWRCWSRKELCAASENGDVPLQHAAGCPYPAITNTATRPSPLQLLGGLGKKQTAEQRFPEASSCLPQPRSRGEEQPDPAHRKAVRPTEPPRRIPAVTARSCAWPHPPKQRFCLPAFRGGVRPRGTQRSSFFCTLAFRGKC